MSEQYLLIASRDPYTHIGAQRCYELAAQLARGNGRVTVVLVQNGVLPARLRGVSTEFETLIRSGVRVVADELSLRERGITPEQLAPGVESTSLEPVIEAMERGAKVLWH